MLDGMWVSLVSSRMKAPAARGIRRRNENLAAFSFSSPRKSPDEIVIPDLETPGNRARIWRSPIIVAFFVFRFESCFASFVRRRIVPVKRKVIDRIR